MESPSTAVSYPHDNPPCNITITIPDTISFKGSNEISTTLKYPTPYKNVTLGNNTLNAAPGKGVVTDLDVLSSILLILVGNLNKLLNVPLKLLLIDGPFDESWFDQFKKQSDNMVIITGFPNDEAENVAKLL